MPYIMKYMICIILASIYFMDKKINLEKYVKESDNIKFQTVPSLSSILWNLISIQSDLNIE